MAEPTTFNAWFDAKLRDYASDIANHGADAGYPAITYTADCCEVFERFAPEIWERAVEMADDLGHRNVAEMIGGFGRADMCESWDGFRTLLVWFACEERARELVED